MAYGLKLQVSYPIIRPLRSCILPADADSRRYRQELHLPVRRLASLFVRSSYRAATEAAAEPSFSPQYTTSVGSSSLQLSQWNLTHRHVLMLNVIACATAVSGAWLFFSAIPALLAFKRAAESLEKLMDVTREELPDTMAAIRLSGMEISDLTMELSDLGQEITQGVRKSTRAVRVAEESLRGLTNMAPSASVQIIANPKLEAEGPALAKTARGIREGIVKSRGTFQIFLILTRFSRMAFNHFSRRAKQ